MNVAIQDRRSLQLLLSLFLLIVLTPFLENHPTGEFMLVILIYLTLAASLLELHGKETFRWLAIIVAIPAVPLLLAGLLHPVRWLVITGDVLLVAFFGISLVGLFSYLGGPGIITSGRVYASVSLYLILAIFWSALYNMIEAIYPGSFVEQFGYID